MVKKRFLAKALFAIFCTLAAGSSPQVPVDTKPPIGEAGAHQVTRHLVSSPRASKEQVVKPKGDEGEGSPGLVRWRRS